MATYYADGTLATGNNDGSSWQDAWQGAAGLQTLCDTLTAGDIGYIRNTFTLTAPIDIDQNSGSDGNPIKVIGCGAAGDEGGDPAVIDADEAAANCLNIDDKDDWWWENVEFRKATGNNVNVSATDDVNRWVFHRCYSHSTKSGGGGAGWGGSNDHQFSAFIFCRAKDNAGDGFAEIDYSAFYGCTSNGNGGHGFSVGTGTSIVACIGHGNTSRGVHASTRSVLVVNSVLDGNGQAGVYATDGTLVVINCRLTNNAGAGIEVSSATAIDLYNFFSGNSALTTGTTVFSNDKGSTTRITDADGPVGYEDPDNDKFNLRLGAAGYRTEIDMGGSNYSRGPRGLPTMIVPRIEDQR